MAPYKALSFRRPKGVPAACGQRYSAISLKNYRAKDFLAVLPLLSIAQQLLSATSLDPQYLIFDFPLDSMANQYILIAVNISI